MADTDPQDDFPPRLTAAMQRFDAAYAEWLKARADLAADDGDRSDAAQQARVDRERAAQAVLISTPAPNDTAIWRKWEALERILTDEAEGGPTAYPAGIIAAAAIKADLMALGLKPWPDR